MSNLVMISPEYGLSRESKIGKDNPFQNDSKPHILTLDDTLHILRVNQLIPELNGNKKSGMGFAYCEGMCKIPQAIKLPKMAALGPGPGKST
jgi:hypothetical protein